MSGIFVKSNPPEKSLQPEWLSEYYNIVDSASDMKERWW